MAFLILDHKHQDRSEIRQIYLGPSYNTSFTCSNLNKIDKTSHFSYCNVFWHNKKLIMYLLIHVMHYILMYSLGPIRKSRETAHGQFVWSLTLGPSLGG